MARQTELNAGMYALLIGIDFYFPNQMPDGGVYHSLGGCVRDIGNVDSFLKGKLGMAEHQILKLTATNDGKDQPKEPAIQWPTYQNMVDRFHHLIELAQPGDQVYIHYSGHGGRASTIFEKLKGSHGLDEALVPTDIGNTEARYLRDVEIAYLLKAMVDKGLFVTVVLDSCHSGGATRDVVARPGIAVLRCATPALRKVEVIDTTHRPTDSLVATRDELEVTWNRLSSHTLQRAELGNNWLLEPQGYTLLAACRASEAACEYPFDGRESNGALTYWLLDSLKQIGPGVTYKILYDRIVPKVHSQFAQQTPQLQGIGDRLVFGSERVQPVHAVRVINVTADRIQIETGQAANVHEGADFAIYPRGIDDLSLTNERLAVVEVVEVGAASSWTTITEAFGSIPIQQGDQAVLLDPGDVRLQRTVQLPDPSPETNTELSHAIQEIGSGFLRLAAKDEPADFIVAITASGEYELRDSTGVPIRNLQPVTFVSEPDAASRVVQRLVHLTKFRNVQELDNRDALSPLARKLKVEWLGYQDKWEGTDLHSPLAFEPSPDIPTIREGKYAILRIRNGMQPGVPNDPTRILNIAVLNLQSDWGITQIYPAGAGSSEPLDPGQAIELPIRMTIPQNNQDGIDIFKVLATLDTTDFHWLELPALDQPIAPQRDMLRKHTPLELLLATVAEDGPPSRLRNGKVYSGPSREWATAQVELKTKKA